MQTKDIRRLNLLVLAREAGSFARLGTLTGVQPNYLSLINTGVRNLGPLVARRMEKALGKPAGWLDVLHTPRHERVIGAAQTPEEAALLSNYRACDGDSKRALFDLCQSLSRKM